MSNYSDYGFTPSRTTPRRGSFWGVDGREGTGKNYLAYSAPGPIMIFAGDNGYERPLSHFPDKEIVDLKFPIPAPEMRASKNLTTAHGKPKIEPHLNEDAYLEKWNAFDKAWRWAVTDDCPAQTLVVDHGKHFWDLFRGARMGSLTRTHGGDPKKVYGELNQEFGPLIDLAGAVNGCNKTVMWIMRSDQIYEEKNYVNSQGQTVEKRIPTGIWVAQGGFKGVPYTADVLLNCQNDGSRFGVQIRGKAGVNKEHIGEEYWDDMWEVEGVTDMMEEVYGTKNPISYNFLAAELGIREI